MAQTKNKYQIIQKTSADDSVILHPETDASIVEYDNSQSKMQATTVQGAIDEIVGGGVVTGIKGNKESEYRTGKVNLTPANIGAEEEGKVDEHNSSNSAHSDIRTAVSKAQSKADSAYALAEGRSKAVSFTNISAFVTAFNVDSKDKYKIGDQVYLQTLGVPDLWVFSVENTSNAYTYTSDSAFVEKIKADGFVQVGYFKVSMLEGEKVDLSGYQTKNDNSLNTTAKTVVGAINEVKQTADSGLSKANANATEITKIKDGTTKVPSAKNADTATSATSAGKWTTGRKITVTVGSGTKANGSTMISGSGNQTVDGSADKSIAVNLGDSGVSAGTYSAVQVNAKGIAVAGGQIIEIGTSGQTTPSSALATGGLFFKLI